MWNHVLPRTEDFAVCKNAKVHIFVNILWSENWNKNVKSKIISNKKSYLSLSCTRQALVVNSCVIKWIISTQK